MTTHRFTCPECGDGELRVERTYVEAHVFRVDPETGLRGFEVSDIFQGYYPEGYRITCDNCDWNSEDHVCPFTIAKFADAATGKDRLVLKETTP